MKKILFCLLCTSILYAESNSKSTHIENPTFGDERRFKIVQDKKIKSKEDELENNSQEKSTKENTLKKIFTSEDIEKKKSQSIQDFFLSEGFLMMSSGGNGSKAELSYKGFTSFCIKVYVNGIMANDPTTGEFDWNSIDVNSIESICIEDVPSLNEAEFAGCVIRITTKSIEDKLFLNAGISSFEKSIFDTWFGNFSYGKVKEKFGYQLGGKIISSKNEFERDFYSGTNKNNFSNQGNFFFNCNGTLSNNTSIFGRSTFNYLNLKVLGTGPDLNNGIETDISTSNSLSLLTKNTSIDSKTDIFFNYSNVNYKTSGATSKKDTGFYKIGLEENLKWIVNFNAGINFEWLKDNSKYNRATTKIGASKKFEIGSFFVEPQLLGLFWIKGSCGARILPRISVGFEGINFSAYRMCVLPTFNQLYWPETSGALGNPDLKPEEGWGLNVGFKRDDFPLWAQYNFSYYKNKIRWTNDNNVSGTNGVLSLYPSNSGEGIYNVISAGISQGFFNNKLEMSVDGTYTSATLCSSGKQIMWVPKWQAHASLSFEFWCMNFILNYSFIGRRWTSNDNLHFYPEIHLIDLCINVNFSKNFEGYFKVNNLLDQRIVFHDNYFIQSRKVTVGVKISK